MAHEYYFEVNTDDDKGVPFGPVNKDNLDIVRLIIDFTCWLDANESVTEISYLTIKANPALPLPSWQANYPLDETSTTPPVDTYPLVFVEQSVVHDGKAVVLDLAAGTPQLSYAVSFTAVGGLSRRRRLVDILMVVDKPLNSANVAVAPPVPAYTYPLVINTSIILPTNFDGRVYISILGPITVTLPPSPHMGQVISFLDIVGNLNLYNVTFVGAPGSSVFEGRDSSVGLGGTSVVSNSPREDIRFEWSGTFWEVNRRYVYEDLNIIDSLRIRPWGLATDSQPLFIGPWTDATASGLKQSLFIQHFYDAPMDSMSGAVASPIGMQVDVAGTPHYFVWGFNLEMDIRTTNISSPLMEHVGYASTIRRHPPGKDVAFAYYGMVEDKSGQNISVDVGFELDIRCNGPDNTDTTKFNPLFGSRAIMTLNGQLQNQFPGWLPNTHYVQNDVIMVGVSTTPEHTYVARNAGTTGATKPSFPGGASVADGGIIWDYGTTYKAQISRAINIGTDGDFVRFGCGLAMQGGYYNACIDMSYAYLDQAINPNACGIRLRARMPIDFSGGQTAETQNTRILYYNDENTELAYQTTMGGIVFAVGDMGQVTIILPLAAVNDVAAAGLGVPVGGVYRNGSVLMVRTV